MLLMFCPQNQIPSQKKVPLFYQDSIGNWTLSSNGVYAWCWQWNGMIWEMQKHLFESSFWSSNRYWLGLAISYQIVDKHQGANRCVRPRRRELNSVRATVQSNLFKVSTVENVELVNKSSALAQSQPLASPLQWGNTRAPGFFLISLAKVRNYKHILEKWGTVFYC